MSQIIEIRDPIHGFIRLSEWEKAVVDHPAFQRLRRIRQLGLSELIYPGTTHTRFEHSLGVMHIGTRMFDQIVAKRGDFLKNKLGYDNMGLERDKTIVRFACLLHDIGHAPFSHAAEEIMPLKPDGKGHYKHEDYSVAIVRILLKDIIENHPDRQNSGISADDIADMIEGKVKMGRRFFWHYIISSQLDADRSDYLLRDSYYAGVSYGHFDLNRILSTLTVAYNKNSPVLAIEEGGKHAAEALIIARYMMFWQVYFQKTRRICDYHATEAVRETLKAHGKSFFPPPTSKKTLKEYLSWDDYSIFGGMKNNQCGRHATCILDRKQDRCIYQSKTGETIPQTQEENRKFEEIEDMLGDSVTFSDNASSSWYKMDGGIPIYDEENDVVEELSTVSQIIPAMKKSGTKRIYVRLGDRQAAKDKIEKWEKEKGAIK